VGNQFLHPPHFFKQLAKAGLVSDRQQVFPGRFLQYLHQGGGLFVSLAFLEPGNTLQRLSG
jgi:hypothetical protein